MGGGDGCDWWLDIINRNLTFVGEKLGEFLACRTGRNFCVFQVNHGIMRQAQSE